MTSSRSQRRKREAQNGTLEMDCAHTSGDTMGVGLIAPNGEWAARLEVRRKAGPSVPFVLSIRDARRLRDLLTAGLRALPRPPQHQRQTRKGGKR